MVAGKKNKDDWEVNLKETSVQALREIVGRYRDKVKLPCTDNWKSKSDNELWLDVVGQVALVGNSKQADEMGKGLRKRENWHKELLALSP